MTRTFRVLAFFPADHAEVVNGKLYMHGGFWGRLNFPLFPQMLPQMALVAVLEVPFSAYHAEHRLSLGERAESLAQCSRSASGFGRMTTT